jgi:hypothetical protein
MQFGHERCNHIAELDVCHRGTSSVRFGLKPSCMYASRKPSLPLRVCSCCDDLGSLPVEKLV